jgi:uncharacterized membrane protein (UPF0127 family)
MDTRRVALAVVVGGALVAAVLAVGVQGLVAPLLTTDGYQPPNSTAAPAGGNGTADGTADGTPTGTSTPVNSDYQHATVIVEDGNGTERGRVRAAVAESYQQKYTGLSKTDFLPADRGMLFPYDEPGNHTYVMRGMDFGIDIVYIDADGTITRIHHAEEPPEGADGNDYEYPGYGQYVLEVNYDWTTRHNVSVGDQVRIEDYDG